MSKLYYFAATFIIGVLFGGVGIIFYSNIGPTSSGRDAQEIIEKTNLLYTLESGGLEDGVKELKFNICFNLVEMAAKLSPYKASRINPADVHIYEIAIKAASAENLKNFEWNGCSISDELNTINKYFK
ncbi:hypothetical protein [Simiduia aestuariiviva]|uniref:Uncharacterized protein n=1 Tax=Simiduia aestuariiviva TaxID=1510459 RepID=A0A839UVW5_9GAMM|nr:hypothetical protein [Simiduia aestuariiviva]MBB3169475.1 hypothetical protein [Simiduia aestuariiviva]